MKPVALILSGSGRADGSEIHEAVCTLLALSRRDMPVKIFAPDMPQFRVMDHLSGRPMAESRNVLTEAARIARGKITPLSELDIDEVSAVILPGGIGASANLCSYAQDGIRCEVEKDVLRVLSAAMTRQLPLGFICIAPVLGAVVAAKLGISLTLTIGDDPHTAADIEALGCVHQRSDARSCVTDAAHRVVSTPAYMSAPDISACFDGISELVAAIGAMIDGR